MSHKEQAVIGTTWRSYVAEAPAWGIVAGALAVSFWTQVDEVQRHGFAAWEALIWGSSTAAGTIACLFLPVYAPPRLRTYAGARVRLSYGGSSTRRCGEVRDQRQEAHLPWPLWDGQGAPMEAGFGPMPSVVQQADGSAIVLDPRAAPLPPPGSRVRA